MRIRSSYDKHVAATEKELGPSPTEEMKAMLDQMSLPDSMINALDSNGAQALIAEFATELQRKIAENMQPPTGRQIEALEFLGFSIDLENATASTAHEAIEIPTDCKVGRRKDLQRSIERIQSFATSLPTAIPAGDVVESSQSSFFGTVEHYIQKELPTDKNDNSTVEFTQTEELNKYGIRKARIETLNRTQAQLIIDHFEQDFAEACQADFAPATGKQKDALDASNIYYKEEEITLEMASTLMSSTVSPKQADLVRRLAKQLDIQQPDVTPENVSDIIQELLHRAKTTVTKAQRYRLHRTHGVALADIDKLTKQQASEMITKLQEVRFLLTHISPVVAGKRKDDRKKQHTEQSNQNCNIQRCRFSNQPSCGARNAT